MKQIILKPGKEQSIKRLHPWIFSGAIMHNKENPIEGELVEVYSADKEFLAIGHYQKSSIAIRIITFTQESIDEVFWKKRISSAIAFREQIGLPNEATNCFRLIHGEGDNLPGLIVDYYNGVAVIQLHAVGMLMHLDQIVSAIKDCMGNKLHAIYNKSESTLPFKADHTNADGLLWGKPLTNHVIEYNNTFIIDWEKGQKTGFFLDQRENRKLLQDYCKNKRVLNTFCYTGGFSVFAIQGGASEVVSIDSSARAIDLTNQAIELNFPNTTKHTGIAVDAFDYLQKMDSEFDVIILDPPAFAKHNSALKNALQGYKRINMRAIQNIKKGGILFTFSCSQVVSKEDFRKSVFAAAANTGRSVRILHQLTQPTDHPINIYHPESEYLKGLVLQIE